MADLTLKHQLARSIDEAADKLVFISPIWIWAVFGLSFAAGLTTLSNRRVFLAIFLLAEIIAIIVHIGWAFSSRRWLEKNFDLNPIIDQRHSDILFFLSMLILISILIVTMTFYMQSGEQITPHIAIDAAGSISALGVFFFLFSAPFALVKAENKPSNYGSSTFVTFLMYFYLPLSVYWLRKRHINLLGSPDHHAEHTS